MTGTGDGGMAPGRKIKAFLWLVISVNVTGWFLHKIAGAPVDIVSGAMWIIGLTGSGVILGQSGVDGIVAWTKHKGGSREVEITKTSETKKVQE